jgi:hypothetical protein
MKRQNEKSIIRILLEKIVAPAIAIAGIWYIVPRWPYILLIIIVAFLVLVLVPGINIFKKRQ